MHFGKYFALAALIVTGVVAAPVAEPEPNNPPPKPTKPQPPPPPPTTVNQQNQCGNGATPYCCNTDGFGAYTTCKVLGAGSTCGATTVCCNANNSIQVCLGTAQIL